MPRGEGVPSTDASLLDPHPPAGGTQGGGVGGEVPGGSCTPHTSREVQSPPEGVGGGGWGTPLTGPPTQGGVFLQGLEGGGGGGSAGGWALVSSEEGEGPYNCSRTETLIYSL